MKTETSEYRLKYGIREATPEELAMMTKEQLWHYHASGLKPDGVHFENFRHEGNIVRPVYLEREGVIGWGNEGANLANLRP